MAEASKLQCGLWNGYRSLMPGTAGPRNLRAGRKCNDFEGQKREGVSCTVTSRGQSRDPVGHHSDRILVGGACDSSACQSRLGNPAGSAEFRTSPENRSGTPRWSSAGAAFPVTQLSHSVGHCRAESPTGNAAHLRDDEDILTTSPSTDWEVRTSRDGQNEALIRVEFLRRIRGYTKSADITKAVKAMSEMQASGVNPDAMTATALVDCCIRCRNLPMAEQVFHTMFAKGSSLKPDAVAFAVLLRAYGLAKPPQWINIQKLIGCMEAEYGFKPTTGIYNELLETCARNNDVEKGIELLDQMQTSGLMPDYFTVEAVKRRKTLRSHLKKVFS